MSAGPGPLQPAGRWLVGAGAFVNLVLAGGFAFQQSWALRLWPWETGRLSYLFLGAMLGAVAAGATWVAASGETASLPAGFLNLAVALGGIAVHLVISVPERRGLGVAVGLVALVNMGLLVRMQRRTLPGAADLPPLLRASYAVFTLVLLTVGLALILGADGVMPWPMDPQMSIVFGWIFSGDALFFAYAVARPSLEGARAQLWSFLGYDAVLLVPLALHLRDVDATLLPNLVAYLAILVYSAALGVYFLTINPRTRGWGRLEPVPSHAG